MSNTYVPGTCNIGQGEIKRRQAVAIFGLFLIAISSVGILTTDQDRGARLSIFIPAVIFSIGFVQSRKKFCLAYGLAGTFNFGKLGQISKVQSLEDKKADRKTAVFILFQSIALAGVITAIFFILPL
ncbi:MAG: hypothetical protein O3C50_00975 [Actinomycetota bacterium]|nr:hypothetical protein [Actinomycetota bacterium]MDA3036323.1 hypothetical protein [Actinomycetota bacterium]